MTLNKLIKIKTKSKKRRGRGVGSGLGGHTVGRGQKGQKSRAGKNIPRGFEGGQVPLYKKAPQLGGFKKGKQKKVVGVSLFKLNIFSAGEEVTPQKLVDTGVINKLSDSGIKILGNGTLNVKLKLKGFTTSRVAKEKIEKLGGEVL